MGPTVFQRRARYLPLRLGGMHHIITMSGTKQALLSKSLVTNINADVVEVAQSIPSIFGWQLVTFFLPDQQKCSGYQLSGGLSIVQSTQPCAVIAHHIIGTGGVNAASAQVDAFFYKALAVFLTVGNRGAAGPYNGHVGYGSGRWSCHTFYPLVLSRCLRAAFSARFSCRMARWLFLRAGWFFRLHTRISASRRFRCHFSHSKGILSVTIQ